MTAKPERPRRGHAVATGVFLTVFTVFAALVGDVVGPAHRFLVVRIWSGTVLVLVFAKLVNLVRMQLTRRPASDPETTARRPAADISLDPFFETLRAEVKNSLRDRLYFERILSVRLSALFDRRSRERIGPRTGVSDRAGIPVPPIRRPFWRRGVPLATLASLVEKLEKRP